MTPTQFACVCQSYSDKVESDNQAGWEQTRTLACAALQPHSKKKITPHQLLPLPWDGKQKQPQKHEQLTAEERRKKAAEALKRLG